MSKEKECSKKPKLPWYKKIFYLLFHFTKPAKKDLDLKVEERWLEQVTLEASGYVVNNYKKQTLAQISKKLNITEYQAFAIILDSRKRIMEHIIILSKMNDIKRIRELEYYLNKNLPEERNDYNYKLLISV